LKILAGGLPSGGRTRDIERVPGQFEGGLEEPCEDVRIALAALVLKKPGNS
jgi:hypothetical protein